MRRDMLVDAALELLGTQGSTGTTVRAVCHQARLNPRYFYESFSDLDELVVAVYDSVVRDLRRSVIRAMGVAEQEPGAQLRASIASTVAFIDEDRRRAMVLYVEALGNEALNKRRAQTNHDVVQAVEEYAFEQYGTPAPGERIGAIAASILVGGIGEMLVAWVEGRLEVDRDQLVDDATTLLQSLSWAAAHTAASRDERHLGDPPRD